MSVSRFMAKQFSRPHGVFGRLFMGHLLKWSNTLGNALIFSLMDLTGKEHVLEVGFGGASLMLHVAEHLPEGTITRVELSETMLVRARGRANQFKNIERRFASVDDLPFEDDQFDGISSVNTIYFWTDLEAGLMELAQVIRPKGKLVLGFGSDTDMRRSGYAAKGFSLYSAEHLSSLLKKVGFRVDCIERLQQERGAFYGLRAIRENSL